MPSFSQESLPQGPSPYPLFRSMNWKGTEEDTALALAPFKVKPLDNPGPRAPALIKAQAEADAQAQAQEQARKVSLAVQKDVTITRRKSSAIATPPPPKSTAEKAKAAAAVLNRYRIEYKNDWDIPESVTKSQALIEGFMNRGESIELIMPAFPFKSSNRSKKVLGSLPDEAERISLHHLNGLCESIKSVTAHECHLTIISDGISYNDILNVSDKEVWTYGQTLRRLAEESGCSNIRFSRIYDLLGPEYAPNGNGTLTEAEYLERVPEYRVGLEKNIPEGFVVTEQIANDPDTAKTYCGYKKFLETERDVQQSRSKNEKENAAIAKRMMLRGKAFAESILKAFPVSVRLSIHPSADVNKVSITLLPQENGVVMTPWHGAVVRSVDGTVTIMHARDVPAVSHELIYEDGRPTYFRERSDLFDWNGKDLHFQYLYPTGIMVRPTKAHSKYALCTVDMQKVRFLSEKCSPVVLRNFTETMDRRAYTAKAYDLGEVLPWKSGVIQEVKNEANPDPSSNSVVSSEAMPMHYDGMFKLKTVKDETTGEEKKVSDVPRFQYFVSQSVAAPGDGYTLFSSSARFIRYLPQSYNINKLSKIRWKCHNHGFFDHNMESLPLVVPHPTLETPCIRWLQPWPRWRTAYGVSDISIQNGSQNLIPLINTTAFDRRVCLYFAWQKGDVVVSDNFSMLHTRTAFHGSSTRELWRIHTN